MTFTVSQIAEQIQGAVVGDGAVEITGFASAELARPGDLTFADNQSHLLRRNNVQPRPSSFQVNLPRRKKS
jgi:UDP-3-O-[3-hydroxymyristoyl] glucosamine N-acyltransferase